MKQFIKLILVIVPILTWQISYAQLAESNLVSGTVCDENKKPILGTNILLFNKSDSLNLILSTISDSLGHFSFSSLKLGQYSILIKSFGYQNTLRKTINLTRTNSNYSLGVISLQTDSKVLGEVIVTGEPPLVTQKLGVITVNMNSSYLKTATNTLDVLSRSPGIRVDVQGNILLANGVSPVVYMDGKQIPLTSDELKSIAREDIESIEIMPNASARYDGDTKAVIELKLKRDKNLGIKGNLYGGGYVNRKFLGSETGVSITYKTKKWINYIRLSTNISNNFLLSNSSRVSADALGNFETFNINGLARLHTNPVSFQTSSDYSFNTKNTIGFLIKGLSTTGNDVTQNTTDILNSNGNYSLPTLSTSLKKNLSIGTDLSYKLTLEPSKTSLQAYLDFIHYNYQQEQTFVSDFTNAPTDINNFPSVLISNYPSTTNIFSFRIDYTKTFNKGSKISAGMKNTNTDTDNKADFDSIRVSEPNKLYHDYSKSNQFLYKERINAGYIGYTFDKKNNSFDLAVRLENTKSQGNSLTLNQSVNRNYLKILPSFSFQHNFSKTTNLSLDFSRKLSRPTFFDLNPFRFYTNPYTYNEGNPFLLPSTITSTDIGYHYKDLNITLKHIIFANQFAQLPLHNPVNNTLAYIRTNLDKVQNFSIESNFDYSFVKWWKIHHYLVLYHTKTTSFFDNNYINNGAFSVYLYGQHAFTLPNKFNLNLSYYYSGPSASQVYTVKSNSSISFGLQKSFFKEKINTQINISDIFNFYRESFYGYYNNFYINNMQKRGVQQINIRFTYSFGKSTFNRQNKYSGSTEEENRASH
ncbi:outer membrane beta-barrel family protein [Hymenobacter psoromatis]|uniref:outer membrane beta-barrel family protein n=1 Tax=Hymenobacter psoromatis TaxID=1484116 RepID=UPI001CBBE45F|nr:outer membrane beta-barrel family protein [Hymenobacter psoromatis]